MKKDLLVALRALVVAVPVYVAIIWYFRLEKMPVGSFGLVPLEGYWDILAMIVFTALSLWLLGVMSGKPVVEYLNAIPSHHEFVGQLILIPVVGCCFAGYLPFTLLLLGLTSLMLLNFAIMVIVKLLSPIACWIAGK